MKNSTHQHFVLFLCVFSLLSRVIPFKIYISIGIWLLLSVVGPSWFSVSFALAYNRHWVFYFVSCQALSSSFFLLTIQRWFFCCSSSLCLRRWFHMWPFVLSLYVITSFIEARNYVPYTFSKMCSVRKKALYLIRETSQKKSSIEDTREESQSQNNATKSKSKQSMTDSI